MGFLLTLHVLTKHRFWQASVLVGHKIVVHGGWNGSNHCHEDLWVFDTDSFAWMQPRAGGLPPTARCVSGVWNPAVVTLFLPHMYFQAKRYLGNERCALKGFDATDST